MADAALAEPALPNLADVFTKVWPKDRQSWAESVSVPFDPFKHQLSGVAKAIRHDRYGLYHDIGTGKTFTACLWTLFCAGHGIRTVVIMPPVLIDQFVATWESIEGNPFDHTVYRGKPSKRSRMLTNWKVTKPDVVFMSFDMFRKDSDEFRRLGFEALVVDEAHGIKNASTKLHKAVNRYVGKPEERRPLLLMTGTPIPNTLDDAYGLIKTITPGVYMNKRHFERLHVVKKDMGSYSITVGYRNTDMLNRHLYLQADRVLKADVLTLDAPTITTVPVQLYPTHMALYKKLLKERVLRISDTEIIDAVQASALRMQSLQLISTPEEYFAHPPPGQGKPKVISNAVHDTVETLLDSVGAAHSERVILFCRFRRTIRALANRLEKYRPCLVYGDSNSAAEVAAFKKDERRRLLIAQYQAGGVGLSLEKQSSTVIFVEPTSVYGEFLQSGQRVHRAGQTKPVVIYVLKILGTHSPRAITQMMTKKTVIKEVQQDRTSMLDELGL